MTRITYRSPDRWSSRGDGRHYRLPLATDRTAPPVWQLALLLAAFLATGAGFLWSTL